MLILNSCTAFKVKLMPRLLKTGVVVGVVIVSVAFLVSKLSSSKSTPKKRRFDSSN